MTSTQSALNPAPPLEKVLVANRGEIAIRVFRACTELGIKTVAIYSHEDRLSLHRYKADEAYQVGEAGSPVQSYLDGEEITALAHKIGATAIHPGYGFLSERSSFRRLCEARGILFIGPSEETLEVAGDKTQTKALADRVGVPTIPGSGLIATIAEAVGFAKQVGYPVMVKAAFGGGGRGMRLVENEADLPEQCAAAQTEALAAFGRSEVFIEKYVRRPKHIEVQLLGDGTGAVVHLFERDCSVQRRHQKVTEVAPAISLDPALREKLYGYGLALARELQLKSAATAEFLVSESNEPFFIEINPRIQVEHTVTEELTGVDIVQTQLRIGGGATLSSLGLEQDAIRQRGAAIQCRITTENPENNFVPDYGKLVAYRSAAGFGVRLDAGSAFAGGIVTPFYDSLLVKVTTRGESIVSAANRMRRALSEFRVRGVSTNIPFLENLLKHPEFLSGNARTSFLEEHPEVFVLPKRADRANRLLRFIAEVTVNGDDSVKDAPRPKNLRPPVAPRIIVDGKPARSLDVLPPPPAGWREQFQSLGREAFLKAVKAEKRLLITDTTFRDAHQSLAATRVRSTDMLPTAHALSYNCPQLFSLEMWGGATFDVMLRFLREDPWERLQLLREAIPNILFQMLIRGANGVGYTSYPDNVITEFSKQAFQSGIDIFRIFDSLNSVDRMTNAIEAARNAGAIAEACICYTGDLMSEQRAVAEGKPGKFTLDYYCTLAKELVARGADIIAIKDMAGLVRPYAATALIEALQQVVDVPIHFHTHDTAGGQLASYLKASEAGVDIVDCAFSSMSGVTSQPPLEAMVAALQHTERDTGLDLDRLTPISSYWEAVRPVYAPFESDLRSATSEVYKTEIPGGQYSNFRPQAESLGLGDKWTELKQAYIDANQLFGGIVKVTPSSKVVGDLAIFMVANGLTPEDVKRRAGELDFPASVLEFLRGDLGIPHGGFPEPFRTAALRGATPVDSSEADHLPPADLERAIEIATELLGEPADMRQALSYLLYPHVFRQYAVDREHFGKVMVVPTTTFFYGMEEGEEIEIDIEPGKRLFVKLIAVSEPSPNGERSVFYELNGHPRSISVRDRSVVADVAENERADPADSNHVAAPLAGAIVGYACKVGDVVKQDAALFTVEAMKMQSVVRASRSGTVKRLAVDVGTRVAVGDLIVELS